jgi:CheY-like chemotaxis protein
VQVSSLFANSLSIVREKAASRNVRLVMEGPTELGSIQADTRALRIQDMATVIRAYGGHEAIDAACDQLPDLIVLDLIMPEVNGFEVVEALHVSASTARIPILIVTAKEITAEDRSRLNGCVTTIMGKTDFDGNRFAAEVRRAIAGRRGAA